MTEQTIKPGRWPYLLALLILLAAIGMLVINIRKAAGSIGGDDLRVAVPGSKVLTLKETGKYNLYHESPSQLAGKAYGQVGWPTNLTVKLVAKEGGEEIALEPATSKTTYTINNRAGVSVLVFKIDKAGQYELSGAYPEGEDGPETVLAVGQGIGGPIGAALGSCLLLVVALIVSAVIMIVTLVKRSGSKKRLAATTPPAA